VIFFLKTNFVRFIFSI